MKDDGKEKSRRVAVLAYCALTAYFNFAKYFAKISLFTLNPYS